MTAVLVMIWIALLGVVFELSTIKVAIQDLKK